MDTHPFLEFLVSLAPTLAKPVVKTVSKYLNEMLFDATKPRDPQPSPRQKIGKSGLLDAAELSFDGIDMRRALHVIDLANNQFSPNIDEIGYPPLRNAAIALESEFHAYSTFLREWYLDPQSAIDGLYSSRAANLYIRKMWLGNSVFEGAKPTTKDYL